LTSFPLSLPYQLSIDNQKHPADPPVSLSYTSFKTYARHTIGNLSAGALTKRLCRKRAHLDYPFAPTTLNIIRIQGPPGCHHAFVKKRFQKSAVHVQLRRGPHCMPKS